MPVFLVFTNDKYFGMYMHGFEIYVNRITWKTVKTIAKWTQMLYNGFTFAHLTTNHKRIRVLVGSWPKLHLLQEEQ